MIVPSAVWDELPDERFDAEASLFVDSLVIEIEALRARNRELEDEVRRLRLEVDLG
jgi:hypothetical protein